MNLADGELLQTIIDQLPIPIAIRDRDDWVILSNRQHYLDLGASSASEVVGTLIDDKLPTAITSWLASEYQRVMETGEPLLNKLVRRDDLEPHPRWNLWSAAPLRTAAGEIVGTVSTVTEIQESRRSLRIERDILHALMDNIPDLVFLKDTSSWFTPVNNTEARVLGIDNPEDSINKTDFDFVDQDTVWQAEASYENEQELLANGRSLVNVERELRWPGQKENRWYLTTKAPIRDEAGTITGLVGISRDITERRLMKEMLRGERDLLHALIDNLPYSVYFKDAASRFTRVNQVASRQLGLDDPDDTVGLSDADVFDAKYSAESRATEVEIMRTGIPIVGREIVSEVDGELVWDSVTKAPTYGSDGEPNGIVGIGRVITE